MKKGKSVKLNLYNPIKSVYGTVDSKNLKSVYINIQSWITPKYDTENWIRIVGNLNREIKHSVFNSINQKIGMLPLTPYVAPKAEPFMAIPVPNSYHTGAKYGATPYTSSLVSGKMHKIISK